MKATTTQEQIQEAKDFLKQQGFFTDNLWHIDDVKQTYKCKDEQAYQVLDSVLNSEYTTSEVFSSIDDEAFEMGLKKKK